jgi:hypothetical protein
MKTHPAHLEKIIAVERILQRYPKGITMKQIIDKLYDEYGITADRRGIYNDIYVLTRFMPIYTERRGYLTFYCLQRSDTE